MVKITGKGTVRCMVKITGKGTVRCMVRITVRVTVKRTVINIDKGKSIVQGMVRNTVSGIGHG